MYWGESSASRFFAVAPSAAPVCAILASRKQMSLFRCHDGEVEFQAFEHCVWWTGQHRRFEFELLRFVQERCE